MHNTHKIQYYILMLLSFSIINYRSIKDKITLSMLPVKSYKELSNNVINIDNKVNALRSAVIYGANASGKSNIIQALNEFIGFIRESSSNKFGDDIQIYDPFLLDKESFNLPVKFELEFLIKEVRYFYSVSYNDKSVLTEDLFFYPKGQRVRFFERKDINTFRYGTILKGEKKSIENRLLPNQLYLSKAANENLQKLSDVYLYFDQFLSVYSMLSGLMDLITPGTIIGSALQGEEGGFFKQFEKIITAFDVGIDSLKIKKSTKKNKFFGLFRAEYAELFDFKNTELNPTELEYEIVSLHKIQNDKVNHKELVEFSLERESAGTKNLFTLALFLLEHFRKGTVMIIDEFEKSLHPHIVCKLVQMFHDPELNINNAQLIFSTHAVNLLDSELFRRDQVWFTEKDEFGVTDLYSLSQVEGIRKDVPYDKWYLSGRFGATPIVNDPGINFNNEVQERK